MKKLLFLFILFSIFSQAQEKAICETESEYLLKNKHTLLVINGIKTFPEATFFTSKSIVSIKVIEYNLAKIKYGKIAKYDVLVIKLQNSKLLNLKDFYKEYKISKENQNLPIILNKHFVDEKEYLLLDKTAIISVKILDEQPFVEPVLLPKGKAIYIEAMEMK